MLKPVPTFKPFSTYFDLSDYPSDFSPCHRRVLSARQISPEQLKKTLSQLHPISQLSRAVEAAERIYQAIQNHEKIVIVGDYDADGATAMAVVVSVLRHVKANVDKSQCRYRCPQSQNNGLWIINKSC